MATITTILASDIIASSRVTLNTNFANLNTDKVDINSSYADPAWITSLAGSKITGNIGGNAATATALATARTIAGVSFDGTANIAIPSTGLSDSSDIVRGASSVASGQVLYGTGAGVAGSSANFRYFVGTGNMVLGTTTDDGTNRLQVAGSVRVNSLTATGFRALDLSTSDSTTPNGSIRWYGSDNFVKSVVGRNYILADSILEIIGTNTNSSSSSLTAQFSALSITSSRNTIIGPSPVEGNFRLDVNSSGSSGTLRAWDQTPTTGTTQLIVRAGAGQSTTNLQTWQNSGGTALAGITGAGSFFTGNNANATGDSLIDANGLRFGSTVLVRWSNNLPVNAADISLSRAAEKVLQVGDGGSNANGGLFASSIGVGVTPSIAANVNQVIIRAGSGQSTTNLTTWQNSGGATLAIIASTGDFATTGSVQSPFLLGTDNANAYLLMRGAGGASAFAGLSRSQSQFAVFSDYRIGFLSGTNINASTTGVEVAFARNSSTAIEVNNGTAGTFRDLYLRGVRPVGSTVANLPTASGNTGMIATVTDATVTTIGTTVAGGGGNTVLVWSNGTNWRIYAN